MKKIRKAFTLVEIVVTLAILGISSAMTTLVIINLTSSQKASSDQYAVSNQIDSVNKLLNEYVSYVSLKTGDGDKGIDITFSEISLDKQTITFTDTNSATYSLTHADNKLSIVFSGETYCTNTSNDVSTPDISNYAIAFDTSLGLINITYQINEKEIHATGIVRTS